jgi:uroporphyrinogen-III synthase
MANHIFDALNTNSGYIFFRTACEVPPFPELLAPNDYLRLTVCGNAVSVTLMNEGLLRVEDPAIGFLHQIGSRMAAADPLHEVLQRIVDFATAVVKCDSCFVYVLESKELVLRASKNPHPEVVDRLKMQVGQGITGWVAEHLQPVAVASHAFEDSRFRSFNELPEDRYEAFLSVPVICRNKLVGVINLQHRQPHTHSQSEIQLISTIGFLVGAEIERARLEEENSQLSEELESRKIIERGKGILQRDLHLTEEAAYLMLQKQSRQRRMSMREVAEAIILSEEIKRAQAKAQPA